MKKLLACLALAACATSSQTSPAERVAGCWIARGEEIATTLRWSPDPAAPAAMVGVVSTVTNTRLDSATYRLAPSTQAGRVRAAWSLCRTDSAGACWQVAEGGEGSLEGGRAFIDAHRDRLRISVVTHEGERLIFDGERDGCD